MNFIRLTSEFSVCSQLSPADLKIVRDAGFKAVICMRPDAEAENQPSFESIADAALNLDLEARHLPVQNGAIGDAQVAVFAKMFASLPKPIVGFCRTGNRAGMLWTMSSSIRATEASIGDGAA